MIYWYIPTGIFNTNLQISAKNQIKITKGIKTHKVLKIHYTYNNVKSVHQIVIVLIKQYI